MSPNGQNKDIKVGDTFTVFNPYGQGILANVTYEGSEIDPPTNGEPEGHALGVHVVVDMTNSETPNLVSDSFEISEELPGGMTATEPADSKLVGYGFTDGRPKITEVKQGQKQDGWLLLDVKEPSGTLLWPLNPGTARLPYPAGHASSASPAATS
ncbi:hypothetical protein [Gordonia neofelifaecis]|uniref:Uncharacterized protein n=1 Tax=Gordonia neofelifaecis NRRL B-59395 TaxID=644548 RepID=F1YEA4_9ACTN|nr:hypothetical protein [Gordonia neofelifaecis]EGD56737.1 hypothetical protein SCNU_00125 [Gordonia neofelifaecis NRRL B-59395]